MNIIIKNLIIEDGTSNIPKAKFIENIEELIGDTDPILTRNAARELLAKYLFIERTMISKLNAMESKAPELKDALFSLEKLAKEESLNLYFKVTDSLYAEANIPPSNTVFLWLGANTLVEYPILEAIELIKKHHEGFSTSSLELKNEIEWLREQITIAEVNVSRIHNFCVQRAKANDSTKIQHSDQ